MAENMKKIESGFFARKSDVVARELVGRSIIRKLEGKTLVSLVSEAWSFEGLGKRTTNKQGIVGAPGQVYLMPSRTAILFNIATERKGVPSCVMIRGLIPLDKDAAPDLKNRVDGPGRVSTYLKLGMEMDGGFVTDSGLWVADAFLSLFKVTPLKPDNTPENFVGAWGLVTELSIGDITLDAMKKFAKKAGC